MKEKTRKQKTPKIIIKGEWVSREYAKVKFGFDLYYELLIRGASEYFINKNTETINLTSIENIEHYRNTRKK